MTKEDSLTIAVANYLRLQYPDVLFTHIANERKTSVIHGAKLKRMGVRAGMPDIMIFRSKWEQKYHILYLGLAIELKIGKNKPTDLQAETIGKLEKENWEVAVCYSFDEAKKIIDNYLI